MCSFLNIDVIFILLNIRKSNVKNNKIAGAILFDVGYVFMASRAIKRINIININCDFLFIVFLFEYHATNKIIVNNINNSDKIDKSANHIIDWNVLVEKRNNKAPKKLNKLLLVIKYANMNIISTKNEKIIILNKK